MYVLLICPPTQPAFSLETNTFLILEISVDVWSAFPELTGYVHLPQYYYYFFFRNGANVILLRADSTKHMKQHHQCAALKRDVPTIFTIT